jgi:hypothetical protein
MSTMRDFIRQLADILDPKYSSSLEFPETDARFFVRGRIFRFASVSKAMGIAFGEFHILGREYVKRVLRAWRPREVHLLEDLSQAFGEVEYRANQPLSVPDIHIKRAAQAIAFYLAYLNHPYEIASLEKAIREYAEETSQSIREQNLDSSMGDQS